MTTKQDARVEAAKNEILKRTARWQLGFIETEAEELATNILAAADRVTGGTDQEDAARNAAFAILKRHPDCLRDDVVFNDLIDDIAANIGPSPNTTAAVEAAERALLGIAYMDVYTREGEKPPHEVMRQVAMTAVTQLAAIRKGERA